MSLLLDLPIRRKLLLAFGTIALLTTTMGVIAVMINSQIKTDTADIRRAAVEKARAISTMDESLLQLKLYIEESLRQPGQSAPAGSLEAAGFKQKLTDTMREFERDLALTRKEGVQAVADTRGDGSAAELQDAQNEVHLLDEIATRFGRVKTTVQNGLNGNDLESMAEEDNAHRLLWAGFDQVLLLVEKYEANTKTELNTEIANIETALGSANAVLFSFALVVLLLGSFLTWFISRTVSRPIEILQQFAQRIGRGDLDASVILRSQDEFGLLAGTFNRMTGDLRSKTVSKDYVDSILRSMANTLIVARPDYTIQSVNESTLRLLGYTADELIGTSLERVMPSAGSRPVSLLAEALENGAVSNVDVFYVARDGGAIPMTFSASTLRDADGKVSALVCVAQDISERKRAERALEEANNQLLETSRQAGMAEVATSVLHNVGNVLNSVNVSSTLISATVQKSKVINFGKAAALIEAHRADLAAFFGTDEKGKQLPAYLSKLAANLGHEQKELLAEVDSLAHNILHIKEIVASQQNYARVSGKVEALQVAELAEDALRINAGALERHGVTLVREYAQTPAVALEKHKMLQILVNLIGNAKHACDAAAPGQRRITLRVNQETDAVSIAVIDTGAGISEENLTRVFNYGFTTKREGHGFGLHSSALAAREMGGTLTASSAGPGRGATFTLQFPTPSPAAL